ncbi:MAG: hypothetical protein M3Q34_02185 [bacterium]|nr:hypothetical protein [bacterium]
MSDTLEFKSIESNVNLVSETVLELYNSLNLSEDLKPKVAEINPEFTGSKEFCGNYGVVESDGANTIIVEVVKGEQKSFACCLIPIGTRADLNHIVRKHFNARRVSFAPLPEVEAITKMEYGSITAFGLPSDWKILVDSRIMEKENIILGGGRKISKLLFPTKLFKKMSNVEIIDSLGKPTEQN